jgi:hypothetical protein
MRLIAPILILALAACGGSDKKPDAAASEGPKRFKGLDCKGFPDFVVMTEDAITKTCDIGDAKSSQFTGKIVYETELPAKQAVSLSRVAAYKLGIPDGITDLSSDAPMYSGNDTEGGRTVTVTTELQAAGGTLVTVEWLKINWDAPPPKPAAKPRSNAVPVS